MKRWWDWLVCSLRCWWDIGGGQSSRGPGSPLRCPVITPLCPASGPRLGLRLFSSTLPPTLNKGYSSRPHPARSQPRRNLTKYSPIKSAISSMSSALPYKMFAGPLFRCRGQERTKEDRNEMPGDCSAQSTSNFSDHFIL